jgi:hypothetical protein
LFGAACQFEKGVTSGFDDMPPKAAASSRAGAQHLPADAKCASNLCDAAGGISTRRGFSCKFHRLPAKSHDRDYLGER